MEERTDHDRIESTTDELQKHTSPGNSTDAATLDNVHKLKCLHCGKPFTATRSDAKFDTATCRVAYHRIEKGMGQVRKKRVRRRCDQCSKSYWTSQPDRSRFDTDTCRAQWHHQNRDQKQ